MRPGIYSLLCAEGTPGCAQRYRSSLCRSPWRWVTNPRFLKSDVPVVSFILRINSRNTVGGNTSYLEKSNFLVARLSTSAPRALRCLERVLMQCGCSTARVALL